MFLIHLVASYNFLWKKIYNNKETHAEHGGIFSKQKLMNREIDQTEFISIVYFHDRLCHG